MATLPTSSRDQHRTSLGGSTLDEARRRIIFPLDYPSLEQARAAAEKIAPSVGGLKIGLELFVREGPRAVQIGRDLGLDIFLDLKLHDIPETVGRAVAAAAALKVRYLTVHAAGGAAMLSRAAQVASQSEGLLLLAVTVLTSLDEEDLRAQGIPGGLEAHARRMTELARASGIPGVVASPVEVAGLRGAFGRDVLLVTPGIRPGPRDGRRSTDDQKRVSTPSEAIASGADLLVIGRPIRDAQDPLSAARAIVNEVARTLSATSSHGK
ncbi:orotidine-5'-phosphate decarboxylase [Chondromyces apiculatus]|uniref:Orotidine 5'-phosphate decarboxylase n=1 Tax=Chondromyces apiculatus DSM 436 TaxID=1192034 RepID=A0A017T1M2_9BACT|nr:orotidine-5'-phosphate decarboxylase [Chondromyces apiculatus]EYF02451.1 Orotidine 5'-phosphate decarboxylase [Chondromyces apiculatus DSM 436]